MSLLPGDIPGMGIFLPRPGKNARSRDRHMLTRIRPIPARISSLLRSSSSLAGSIDARSTLGDDEYRHYAQLLRESCESRCLHAGQRLHGEIRRRDLDLDRDTLLGNLLVKMYAASGSDAAASAAFDRIRRRNLHSWSFLVVAHSRSGRVVDAATIFRAMPLHSVYSATVMILGLFENHRLLDVKALFISMPYRDSVLWNTMVTAYTQAGQVSDAMVVFAKTPFRDRISWNAVMGAYSRRRGSCGQVKEIFDEMPEKDVVSWNIIVSIYAQTGNILAAKLAFDRMALQDLFSRNTMINAFAENGHLEEASEIFKAMEPKNTVSWNTMIRALSDAGEFDCAAAMFHRMPRGRDLVSWTSLLQALAMADRGDENDKHLNAAIDMDENCCVALINLSENSMDRSEISCEISRNRWENSKNSSAAMADRGKNPNAAIDVALMRNSSTVIEDRSKISNAGIDLLALMDHSENSLDRSENSMDRGENSSSGMAERSKNSNAAIDVDVVPFMNRSENKNSVDRCEISRNRSADLVESAFWRMPAHDSVCWTVMLGAFSASDRARDAKLVFDAMPRRDVVSWTNLISAAARGDLFPQAIAALDRMPARDTLAFAALAYGFAHKDRLADARAVLDLMPDADPIVHTVIMQAHSLRGAIDDAIAIFARFPAKNTVVYNALATCLVHNHRRRHAIALFKLMDLDGFRPDEISFSTALNAVGSIAALGEGRRIHAEARALGLESNTVVASALLSMYSECGSLRSARGVFESMPRKNQVSWNSMMAAYAAAGLGGAAAEIFLAMASEGFEATSISFVTIISASSHGGWRSARDWFVIMRGDFSIEARKDHFACVADALCRAGKLRDAEELVETMPFEPDDIAWMSLLAACRRDASVEIGRRAAARLIDLGAQFHAPAIVMLFNTSVEVANFQIVDDASL